RRVCQGDLDAETALRESIRVGRFVNGGYIKIVQRACTMRFCFKETKNTGIYKRLFVGRVRGVEEKEKRQSENQRREDIGKEEEGKGMGTKGEEGG
ncbi:hypothetical protein, partial [Streptococcus pyogenes]|uniref:hypothetical protein n=1 Tax=Streptococcus pyogenes TaxID=1314 RepID=UPI0027DD0E08